MREVLDIRRFLLVAGLIHATFCCVAQQKILLIGTDHRVSEKMKSELNPIVSVITSFNPDIICVEYLKPTDTASLRYRHRNGVYDEYTALQHELNIPEDELRKGIASLGDSLAHREDIRQRMRLHNYYLASADYANSEYQAFRIMTLINRDSSLYPRISGMKGFELMKQSVALRPYYLEYPAYIFPLATTLTIDYLEPIDDLSVFNTYAGDFDNLDESQMKDREEKANEYLKVLEYHTEKGDRLSWFNSEEAINYSLRGMEGSDSWRIRNDAMVLNIEAVAKKHPKENIVVFFGAGHIGIVRNGLKKLLSNYRVLTLQDLKK